MRKRVLFKLFSVLTIIIFSFSTAGAGWLDDWFQQYTASGPDYYMGQKRGYITFGSFSARTGLSSAPQPLITFTPPRFRAGCGGIDIFLGGIGFTSLEYMVQRLQRLIQEAPAIAFELALQALTAQLGDVAKNVEKTIDFLNKLQFDECKIFQPLYVRNENQNIVNTFKNWLDYLSEKVNNAVDELFHRSKQQQEQRMQVNPTQVQQEIEVTKDSECPTEFIDLASRGSLLEYAAYRIRTDYGISIPEDMIEVIRALIGDVVVIRNYTSNGLTYRNILYKPINVPGANLRLDMDNLVGMNIYGYPNKQTINLNGRVVQALERAYSAKRLKQSTSSDYEAFVKLSPIPLEHAMNYAVLTGNPAILYSLAPAVAQGIFYNAILHVNDVLLRVIGTYKIPAYQMGCESLNELSNMISVVEQNIRNVIPALSQPYLASLNELVTTIEISTKMVGFEDLVRQAASGKLSKANMDYLMARLVAGR